MLKQRSPAIPLRFMCKCYDTAQEINLLSNVRRYKHSEQIRTFHESKRLRINSVSTEARTRSKAYSGSWSNESSLKDSLEQFGREVGVKQLDDWYSVPATKAYRRLKFIKNYGSLFNVLKKFYPLHNWDKTRFSRVPSGTWNDENSQREALERFGKEHGVKELNDWYSITTRSATSELCFISKYGSLYNMLQKFYPQHKWDRLRFSNLPNGYWADESVQRDALERFGRDKLGVKKLDDWYSVSARDVHNELSFIGSYYKGSLFTALQKLYPQHNWDRLRFSKVPQGSWTESAQRDALERFGKEIGVTELDDWYKVSTRNLYTKLSFIISYYNGSLFNALQKLYPQHNWDRLRFSVAPRGYWKQPDTVQYYQKMFIKWKNENNIRTVSDWYQLAPQQVQLFKRASKGIFGSTIRMLENWFPDIIWQSQYTSQLELQSFLKHVILSSANTNSKTQQSDERQLDTSHATLDEQWMSTWVSLKPQIPNGAL